MTRWVLHLSSGATISTNTEPVYKEDEYDGRYQRWLHVVDLKFNVWRLNPSHVVATEIRDSDHQKDDTTFHTS